MTCTHPIKSVKMFSLSQYCTDTLQQLHSNIQTILNFYGVNIHGDNHNQNRTTMQGEAREFMLEWIYEYIMNYFDVEVLEEGDILELAVQVTELFMTHGNLAEEQLYTLFVNILLPEGIVVNVDELQAAEFFPLDTNEIAVPFLFGEAYHS